MSNNPDAQSGTRKGILFVISAPSGAGKSTICREIMKIFPKMRLSVSCTTRCRRTGEIEGRDYHFVDRKLFKKMIEEGAFAEWAEVYGELYGTTVEAIREAERDGIDLLLDIDWHGARQIKKKLCKGIYIFILPPSVEELERRLNIRGNDAADVIKRRLDNAREEISHSGWYNYNILNNTIEEAVSCMKAIIVAERCRPQIYPATEKSPE